jgi:hypothetical protein
VKIKKAFATLGALALIALPASAVASNSHAGQHGNHCGLGHAKHVKGSGGSKVGQSCQKAPHGGGDDDDSGDAS